MKDSSQTSNDRAQEFEKNQIWRLAEDLVIAPVEKLPKELLEKIDPEGKIPKGRFAIQRKNVRSFPKIVTADVVEVLRAFGEKGTSYQEILERFVQERNLGCEKLDADLRGLIKTLVRNNLLVDGNPLEGLSAQPVEPSFREGDLWLNYRIKQSIHCLVDSEVYKVEDARTGQLRALKITQARFPNSRMKEDISTRLSHEFEVILKIDHPNVVKVWEHGVHRGRTYGILDWIDGPNVAQYVNDLPTPADDRRLLDLAFQCVEALQAVHAAGYLHGDVHTGNFLVSQNRACLVDFGFSRPSHISPDDKTEYPEGGVIMFMPPEYVRRELDHQKGLWGSVAGEIYSCAVILFSIFTRQLPYSWKFYRQDYMRSILSDPPLSFASCGRAPWPELEMTLHRAMAKNQGDRFSSMEEFLLALKSMTVPASL